jgi:hypothetical protein
MPAHFARLLTSRIAGSVAGRRFVEKLVNIASPVVLPDSGYLSAS